MADDDWAPAAASPLAEVTGTGPRPAPSIEVAGYTDLREVARGGDAIVYRARQISIDRDVAIKVFQIADPNDAVRFERELDLTVRLGRQHPHIVSVLDTSITEAGEPCLVMDFHDLGSLHERLRENGPLPVSDVVAAGTALADALAFAHSHGVLHRDVKPQNVLVLPTSYVLSDFGIARMADSGNTATMDRFSYRHASPQVLDGLPPTEADDVWSLGSTLFTLLDGRAPFAAADPSEDTALSYLRRVRTAQRRELTRDDVPPELADLIDSCLSADRDDRPGSAAEVLRRLRRIRTEERSWNPAPADFPEVDVATRPRPEGEQSGPDGGAPVPQGASPEEPVAPSAGSADDAWAPGVAVASGAAAAAAAPEPQAGQDDAPVLAPSVLAHVGDEQRDDEVRALDVGQAAPARRSRATEGAPEEVAEKAARFVADEDDDERTGLAPAEDDEGDDAGERGDDEGDREIGTGRRIAAFFGGVLLVGAAIGVGSAVIRGIGGGDDPTPTPTSSTQAVPTATDPVTDAGPVNISENNPDYAPVQLAIDDDGGSSITLSWGVPQQEVVTYIVIEVDDSTTPPTTVRIVQSVEPPITSYRVEGLDADAPYCFAVAGVLDGDNAGMSDIVCRR